MEIYDPAKFANVISHFNILRTTPAIEVHIRTTELYKTHSVILFCDSIEKVSENILFHRNIEMYNVSSHALKDVTIIYKFDE